MPTNTYVALDKVTVGSSVGSVTINMGSTISQAYTDLVLVIDGTVGSNSGVQLRFNGDTGSNYSFTRMTGDGSSATSDRSSNATFMELGYYVSSTRNMNIVQIMNYSNSTTFKTVLNRASAQTVNIGAQAYAELWRSTAAITSITISASGNFSSGTTFSLYGIAAASVGAKATGGIISSDSQYYYHTFLSSGTFTPTQSLTCDYLVVAGGGGGGGYLGGGGGAGGLRSTVTATGGGGSLESALSLSATAYTVTIGAGGAGATSTGNAGSAGNNSVFSTITSTAGGFGGGDASGAGGSGGSGGGGRNGNAAGTGTANQGYSSGTSTSSGPSAAGGGGAGAAGGNGLSSGNGGNGGAGVATVISGSSVTYAGGGGGGAWISATAGTGGAGGGGNGGTGGGNNSGSAGTANTGGGGGGGTYQSATGALGGAGGSGIVIVRYAK